MFQRNARRFSLDDVATQGKRTQGHPVKRIGERDNGPSSGHFSRQFERRLDGIGTGRSGEHHLVRHSPRLKDHFVKALQEVALCGGRHVQRMEDALRLQVAHQGLHHRVVVVPVVETAGAAEEVDVLATVLIPDRRPMRSCPDRRPAPYVGSDFRFQLLKDFESTHGRCNRNHSRPSQSDAPPRASTSTMPDLMVNVAPTKLSPLWRPLQNSQIPSPPCGGRCHGVTEGGSSHSDQIGLEMGSPSYR